MILVTTKELKYEGSCMAKNKCSTGCCRTPDDSQAYLLPVKDTACDAGYNLCHSDCNGCKEANKATSCLACMDPKKYFKADLIDPTIGSCIDVELCKYRIVDTKQCVDTKPNNMWCNSVTNECFTCHSDCSTCAASNDADKCTGCSDPEAYVLAWAKDGFGKCVNKRECVIPKYRDDTTRMCYYDDCPDSAICLQCSVQCDGCFRSDSSTSCKRCSLDSEIMLYETGACIASEDCVFPLYRDDSTDICYESIFIILPKIQRLMSR